MKIAPSFLLGAFILAIFGCYIPAREERSGGLRSRVLGYWQAVVEKRWDKAYEYENPLYRKIITKDVYMARRTNPLVGIEGFTIRSIDVKGKEAVVDILLNVTLRVPGATGRGNVRLPIKDIWVNKDGVWFHVPRERRRKGVLK